jgi:hypothetical protein
MRPEWDGQHGGSVLQGRRNVVHCEFRKLGAYLLTAEANCKKIEHIDDTYLQSTNAWTSATSVQEST